jgi:NTP pyrophosphatase (non-canonical NTP hydrolase)
MNDVACFARYHAEYVIDPDDDSINNIIETHYQWLGRMGYTKATPLESLALITSEIGEAVNECRQGEPTDKFGEELADIVLRVFGLARRYNIDIADAMTQKIIKNYASGDNRGRTI